MYGCGGEGVPGVMGVPGWVYRVGNTRVLPGPNPWVFPCTSGHLTTHSSPVGFRGPLRCQIPSSSSWLDLRYRPPGPQKYLKYKTFSGNLGTCHTNTWPNSAKTVPKQCQNGSILRILRCTLRFTGPFDWFMDPRDPVETCIPTAWYL